MDIEYIKRMLESREPRPEGNYRTFGVMVPLIEIDNQVHLLFEVRSDTLKRQPGEISFPGGSMEEGETPEETAVRETLEELLLPSGSIHLMGALDYIVTPFNYIIYPFVGLIQGVDYHKIRGNPAEVERVFSVPLSFFLDTKPLCHHVRVNIVPEKEFPFELIPNGSRYNWKTGGYPVCFYLYNGYIIWGITARIVANLTDVTGTNS